MKYKEIKEVRYYKTIQRSFNNIKEKMKIRLDPGQNIQDNKMFTQYSNNLKRLVLTVEAYKGG